MDTNTPIVAEPQKATAVPVPVVDEQQEARNADHNPKTGKPFVQSDMTHALDLFKECLGNRQAVNAVFASMRDLPNEAIAEIFSAAARALVTIRQAAEAPSLNIKRGEVSVAAGKFLDDLVGGAKGTAKAARASATYVQGW